MADFADLAQYYLEQQEAIREAQRLARRSSEPDRRATLACTSCGEDIDPQRKRALPEATMCFDCQSADEIRARSRVR
jgi:RNA polymerase-binding transcription factor DksA